MQRVPEEYRRTESGRSLLWVYQSARQLGVSPTSGSEREEESTELKKYVLTEVSSSPH